MDNLKLIEILKKHDYTKDFFDKYNINENDYQLTIADFFNTKDIDYLDDYSITKESFIEELQDYIELMENFLSDNSTSSVTLQILPGINKSAEKESFDELIIKPGEIVSIVGPTGSGKSRLLADIEWAANEDTPTKRKVLINGETIDPSERFNVGNKLVAQLSQNMNFVMDLTVEEFLDLHASSRMIRDKNVITKIFNKAVNLAGEKFSLDTPITSLSGGQSRALMIADTAYLSSSPIILIDEIENAGIDRREAIDLLVSNDKIVLMSTHDPILALMADRRIVISNGGIDNIIKTSSKEVLMLSELEELDKLLMSVRNDLRYGKEINIKIK